MILIEFCCSLARLNPRVVGIEELFLPSRRDFVALHVGFRV